MWDLVTLVVTCTSKISINFDNFYGDVIDDIHLLESRKVSGANNQGWRALFQLCKVSSAHLVPLFPFWKKIIPQKLERMISHVVIGYKQTLKFYSCIQPVPEEPIMNITKDELHVYYQNISILTLKLSQREQLTHQSSFDPVGVA